MAVGQGSAAFFHNLPEEGSYIVSPTDFNRETERNDVPQPTVTFTGLGGSRMDQRISNVGLLANIRLLFKGSLVVAKNTGAVTSRYQWPWNVCKRVLLNANGQTSLIQAEGMDLRARRQRIYRNPNENLVSAPGTDVGTTGLVGKGNPVPGTVADGTYSIELLWDLPIVHDDYTLTGAIFAQSDQSYLNWTVEPAAASDLFTLTNDAVVTLTGTFYPVLTFYDIPYVDTQQGRRVVLPDLSWLHGYLATNSPFANTGDVRTPFIRTAGQLISFAWYLDNGGAAQIAPTALSEIRFEYGGNRRPRTLNPPDQLAEKNQRDYNGLIQPGYAVLDFEVDNPARDIVYPKGVSELVVVNTIPAATSVNANAHIHFVEETLFAGR
jgi:hypothetical protein